MISTTIDILDDSVSDIMDKLFYQATDGKTIDYAWDAPQPAAVNPISATERLEWGDKAMSVQFNRVARDPRRMGSRKISSLKRYAQRTTAEPFFGYVSEPPKAKVFKSEEPIGPVAKALKAAGTLAALAERNDESPDPVWSLFSGIYGPVTDTIKVAAKPDLSRMSDKDMIKLVRSSNHALYGFNACGPAVSVDTGKYKPETMPLSYQFDWHAMCLTMRFIGEMVAKYSNLDVMAVGSIKFAPAYAEARMLNIPKFTSDLVVTNSVGDGFVLPDAVRDIAEKTMKYYTGNLAAYGVRAMLRADARAITVKEDSAFTVDVVREIASKLAKKPIALPKTVARYRPDDVVAEIVDAKRPRFYETIVKSATRARNDYLPTWKSVSTAVWASAFYSRFDGDDVLRSILRKQAQLPDMSESETSDLLRAIARSMPRSIGYTIFMVLRHMCPTVDKAILEFVTMISKLGGAEYYELHDSYDSMYTSAIADSRDPGAVIAAIHRGFSQYQSKSHSFKAIQFEVTVGNDALTNMLDAMDRYIKNRMKYWTVHYESRVQDNRTVLKTLKEAAQLAGLRGKAGITSTMALSGVSVNRAYTEADGDEEELSDMILKAKKNVVKYSMLAMCFKSATIAIDAKFNVEVNLPLGAYRGIILRSADNYVRKRMTWGKKLADGVADWDEKREKVYTLTRHTDIARYVDATLIPNMSYFTILQITNEKLLVTQKMISRMLKRFLLAPHDDTEEEESIASQEEAAAVTEFDEPTPLANIVESETRARFQSATMYDILAESSESEESEARSEERGINSSNLGGEAFELDEEASVDSICLGERWIDKEATGDTTEDKQIVDIVPERSPGLGTFRYAMEGDADVSFNSDDIIGDEDSGGIGRTQDNRFSFKDWLSANRPGAFRYDCFAAFLNEYFPEDDEELTEEDVFGPLSNCEAMYDFYVSVASKRSGAATQEDITGPMDNNLDIE